MTKSSMLTALAARKAARFADDESGATAIEYAMIASGVGAAVAAAVYTLGSQVKDLFTTLAGLMT